MIIDCILAFDAGESHRHSSWWYFTSNPALENSWIHDGITECIPYPLWYELLPKVYVLDVSESDRQSSWWYYTSNPAPGYVWIHHGITVYSLTIVVWTVSKSQRPWCERVRSPLVMMILYIKSSSWALVVKPWWNHRVYSLHIGVWTVAKSQRLWCERVRSPPVMMRLYI